ncbi:glutamate--tRNA ligase [Candidatus Falkowbacteria bacterium RIFOXYC2_FULL_48_21]|uniref:Glutamate--tRNA ligase n=1 Tax=Candidatus Falkowbacteria bacterium RIFOXYC2_FULL_48_21 TaxID=1798005 RepID=A0A1F5TCT9_9BACT|nr:MAG: glutamate--tRNA ligase [Candidatus Falkowbacteria bacterium RIFOXYC2_FULL_48_21]
MDNFSNVRVRIAPSPTGFVHVGNLRTMLYNYLFAKHNKGKFLIRIEDTDQTRLVHGAVENLLQALKWAGIESDEGPYLTTDNKVKERGEFGPYVQSERLDIYKQQIQTLLEKGKAYPCFCTKDRIEKVREEQSKNKLAPKYDNFCRDLTKAEAESMMRSGTPYVIRFKMPEDKNVIVKDMIHGEIVVNTKDLDDYVLIKSDGFPTYHFANVVDDHFMKITHVMRGDEWIASTPKHVLLYDAFEWQAPQFAHLPTLLSKTKKKLSKRDGDVSVKDFIDKGYLKDALINFIALLGWNAGTEQEIYTLNELIHQFTLDNVHKAGAVFDLEKLDWINGMYIRKMSSDEFYEACVPYLINAKILTLSKGKVVVSSTGEKVAPAYIKDILALEQPRVKKLTDIVEAVGFFFANELTYDAKNLIWRKSDQATTLTNLQLLEKLLHKIKKEEFSKDNLKKTITELIEKNGLDTGGVLWPMRYALSGRDHSPDPYEIAGALGKDKSLARISAAITKLGQQ